jgi:DNA repair protein RadC
MNDTPQIETPWSRLEKHGAAALSDSELMAVMMHPCGCSGDAARVAGIEIVNAAGGIAGLLAWTPKEFERAARMTKAKALQMSAISEVARRMMAVNETTFPLAARAEQVVELMHSKAAGLEVEKFWVLCLNVRNRLIKCVEISSGTATSTLAHPREVFRAAVRESAAAIVCVHNHPSGDPAPSPPDVHITRQLRESARAVDIHLLDHVILGRPAADPLGRGFYSFRDAGMI